MKWRKYIVTWRERGRVRRTVVHAPSARAAYKHAPYPSSARGSVQIRLGDTSPALPYQMAEFFIGRGVGLPIGTSYSKGARSCRVGRLIEGRVQKGLVPFSTARAVFLGMRARQVGGDAGATLVPAWGMWKGGREPAMIGKIFWMPGSGGERTPTDFRRNMSRMCEALACGLAQREVLVRLSQSNGGAEIRRCSPTGAPWPVSG